MADFLRQLTAGVSFKTKNNVALLEKERAYKVAQEAAAAPAPPKHAAGVKRDRPVAGGAGEETTSQRKKPRMESAAAAGPVAKGYVSSDSDSDADFYMSSRHTAAAAAAPQRAVEDAAAAAARQHQEGLFAMRKRLRVKVRGNEVGLPWPTFDDIPPVPSADMKAAMTRALPLPLATATPPAVTAAACAKFAGVRDTLLRNIEASAFKEPTAVQMESLPAMTAGRDVLAMAPTGSGKTAAFALPLIMLLQAHFKAAGEGAGAQAALPGPRSLILVPTKELAVQGAREASRFAAGTGLSVKVLTRDVASGALAVLGTSGGAINARKDAADLVKTKRLIDSGKRSHRKRVPGAAKKKKEEDDDEEEDEEDEGEEVVDDAEEASSEDGSDGEEEEDEEEEEEVTSPAAKKQQRRDKGSEAAEAEVPVTVTAVPAGGWPLVVPAPLPSAEILVATPLLLVSSLRHAQRVAFAGIAPGLRAAVAADLEAKAAAAAKEALAAGDAAAVPGPLTEQAVMDACVRVIIPALRVLVCDEADKLLELGFLEQMDEIAAARPEGDVLQRYAAQRAPAAAAASPAAPAAAGKKKGKAAADAAAAPAPPPLHVQCGMFSATMPEGIEAIALALMHDPLRIEVGQRGSASANVDQKLVFVGREEGKLMEVKQMVARGWNTPVLMFVQSKERALQLHRALLLDSIPAEVIHSSRTEAERATAMTRFRRGDVGVLVATDLLGRGIDFKGVRTVINYDFPQSAVAYVHRIGRTGRAGHRGQAITFFTEADIPSLRSIANVMRLSGCEVPEYMLTLKKLSRRDKKRAEKSAPRRRSILPPAPKKSAGGDK